MHNLFQDEGTKNKGLSGSQQNQRVNFINVKTLFLFYYMWISFIILFYSCSDYAINKFHNTIAMNNWEIASKSNVYTFMGWIEFSKIHSESQK